ncbi:MAG TPA: transposase [Cytophagales bacterium]|nr:transposase [Cytophagales bacterium]
MNKYRNKYRIPSARLQGYDYGAHGMYFITICTRERIYYFGDIAVETHNCASLPNCAYLPNIGKDNLNVETDNYPSNNSNVVETDNHPSDNSNVIETDNYLYDNSNVVEMDNYPSNNSNVIEMDNYLSDNSNVIETDNCPSLRYTRIGTIALDYWIQIPQHFPFIELDEFVIMPNHIHGILFFNKPEKTDWCPNQFGIQSQNLGSVIRGFKSSVKRYANQHNIEFEWQSRYHDRIIRDEKELNNIREYIRNNPAKWVNDKLNLNNKTSP